MTARSLISLKSRRQHGAALVITLALLVLMVALVLAFFSRVNDSSKASVVASSQAEVNLLTKSALDVVVGDLRTEMLSGSAVTPVQNYIWMKPNTDAAWSPFRQVKAAVASDANFQNLIKQSVSNSPFFPAVSPYGTALLPTIRGASTVSTSGKSADQHVFTPVRWNLPALAAGSFVAGQVPDWIYVTRSGVPESQVYAPAFKDQKSTSAVLGRFAFNIYDISGLLDINVAGFPVVTSARAADKGGLPWSQLETTVNVAGQDVKLADPSSALLSWRNASSLTDYEEFVRTNGREQGSLPTKYGNRQFDTRGDLIRYASRSGGPINTKALPLLTTFSRTVNAPSWMPSTPSGSSIDYASLADQTSATNRNISGVRVLAPFTRRDGTTAKVGEPLINSRFPLSKLALIQTGDATSISKYLGLTKSASNNSWTPDLNASNKIRTLEEVAQQNREPNFFELLKAGILTGALGANNSGQSLLTNYESDLSLDRQILQIGANIIDQYDEDSIPTWISTFNLPNDGGTTGDVFGVENHPRISGMFQLPVRRHDGNAAISVRPNDPTYNPYPWVNVFLQFQVWNPHLNAAFSPGGDYRIIATEGRSHIAVVGAASTPTPPVATLTGSAIYFGVGPSALDLSEPKLLNADRVSTSLTSTQNLYTASNAKVAGLFLGQVDASHNRDGDNNNANDYSSLSAPFDTAARVQLQWKSPAGDWVAVQEVGPLREAVASGNAFNGSQAFDEAEVYTNAIKVDTNYVFSDPRTMRHGIHGKSTPTNQPMQGDQNLRPTLPGFGKTGAASFHSSPLWTIAGVPAPYGLEYAPAELAENDPSSSATWVKGTDGIGRLADSIKTQNVFAPGSPSRPYMLNRPFRSVGEMAYAFRDEPWKSLDFFTAKSGDGAVLDLFSVNEAPVQAGVINVNRADSGVLEAIIAGSLNDPAVAASGNLDAKAIATALRQALGPVNAPSLVVKNRADIPKLVESTSLPTSLIQKRQRETVPRIFGDVVNSRTWNLMIDLVVQTGKIGQNGSSLADFAMRAERRIWAHVAIDRISGEVIDIQVETVNE